ncbi:MAG: acetyl/propionyl/methylcrotonyl-CoA carboxylase subunit alpha [Hyphomicrobiaceae bacterium]|nr:acetyl/propionyl/methylcrotonyl-CoA carboxylase subunit alpha [Hyphomicrobiaceae bacterium]
MFKTLLIANRGEIACRVMRTSKRLGLNTVAVYSDADRDAFHVATADAAYRLGPAPAAESYLRIDRIIAAAKASGADAIHPGYGFLSENAGFAEAVAAAGMTFIGPPASAIRAMGLKDAAKTLMQKAGVPVVPGYHGDKQDAAALAKEAAKIGYPVLIKARAGGGGKGMRRVDRPEDFKTALEGAQREAQASFGDAHVLIERYVAKPRHIEVQVFADTHGNVIHLGERDCSLQRRHQKVIEEAPAPGMTPELRASVGDIAVRAAKAISYVGAGTIEFIADTSQGLRTDAIYFMEMNTRLQVEHPVTEAITGLDLVEWQLRVAAGEPLPLTQAQVQLDGHAFEARIYAEDPARGFLPSPGTLAFLALPDGIARVDTGVRQGDTVSPFYDPLIAKVIVHGETRAAALGKMASALDGCRIAGPVTNVPFLQALVNHAGFQQGDVDTGLIERDLQMLTSQAVPPREVVAIAAIAALRLTHPPAGPDPWSTLTDWRHWDPARRTAHLEFNGARFDLSLTGAGKSAYEVADATGTLAATLLDGNAGGEERIAFGDRIISATPVEHDGKLTIHTGGRTYVFGLPDRTSSDDAEEDDAVSDRVMSPMPGLVKVVHARRGARVTRGQPLVVIEAMKMEYTMTAPRDGKIADVAVSLGDNVQSGALLLALEPEHAPGPGG